MRPIARQSARLASSSRIRHRARPAHLPQKHVRSFTRSAQHESDTRGPHDPPNHTKPIEAAREDHRQRRDVTNSVDKEDGAEDSAFHDEPRLAASKTRRQRRKEALTPDVPKPPPIPDWFLKHNVKLQQETVRPDLRAKSAQVLRCIDTETGHTLFTLPFHEAWPVPGTHGRSSEVNNAKKLLSTKASPEKSFFDPKFPTTSAKTDMNGEAAPVSALTPVEDYQENVNSHDFLRWAFLEAETAIRAGFAVSTHASQASSTAISRVDLSLQCPDGNAHQHMDEFVEDLAATTQSDLIRLDANDFEDLLADYVGQSSDSPGSFSNLAYDVFDGMASNSQPAVGRIVEEEEEDEDEMDEDEEDDENDAHASADFSPGFTLGTPRGLEGLRKALSERRNELSKALGMRISGVSVLPMHAGSGNPFQAMQVGHGHPLHSMQSSDPQQYDDARLKALLDSLLDATRLKQEVAVAGASRPESWNRLTENFSVKDPSGELVSDEQSHQALSRFNRSSTGCWYPDVAGLLWQYLKDNTRDTKFTLEPHPGYVHEVEQRATAEHSRTIVHLRDMRYISGTRVGESVIRALVRVVQKRRRSGQEIIIVGTTARDTADALFAASGEDSVDQEFRAVRIPPVFKVSKEDLAKIKVAGMSPLISPTRTPAPASTTANSDRRVLEINLRHLQSMLKRLRPDDQVDLFTANSLAQMKLTSGTSLGEKVLTFNRVQRIALTAIGLAQTHAVSEVLTAAHVGMAVFLTSKTDDTNAAWHAQRGLKIAEGFMRTVNGSRPEGTVSSDHGSARLEKIRKSCNQHESRLLSGVVDAQNIKTGFKEVHAPEETIEALKTLTSLSLLRPEAFKYGVLAADRLPGLMLYGPPGTGKTLLAKAVAKESRATVLEISGAQIYEKYVGEGEKMVRAVFSLAKKLSPCVVFIDEADAIFGSRNSAGNRNTHREIINQFLREWDGMDNHNVFIMVASNRPFDMDDAVLRRLPRRLLVDLPVAKDRESILKIHLKDEVLDETVKLDEIANNTALYSGSDLKNLCVAAALACVREENDLANRNADDKDFKLPDMRTLSGRHFDKAIKEISASISEDMSSLTGIKKFDEQYGERRGKKPKNAYGFGSGDGAVIDESSVRVRPSSGPPPAI